MNMVTIIVAIISAVAADSIEALTFQSNFSLLIPITYNGSAMIIAPTQLRIFPKPKRFLFKSRYPSTASA